MWWTGAKNTTLHTPLSSYHNKMTTKLSSPSMSPNTSPPVQNSWYDINRSGQTPSFSSPLWLKYGAARSRYTSNCASRSEIHAYSLESAAVAEALLKPTPPSHLPAQHLLTPGLSPD